MGIICLSSFPTTGIRKTCGCINPIKSIKYEKESLALTARAPLAAAVLIHDQCCDTPPIGMCGDFFHSAKHGPPNIASQRVMCAVRVKYALHSSGAQCTGVSVEERKTTM